jgi:GLPGLI family protein
MSAACKRKAGTGSNEGKISFSITYDQSRVGGYSTAILPKEMIMEFSGNKVMSRIEGGLGFFSLVHLSDMRSSQHTTWLKFIDKKYIYEGDKRESPCCFSILDGMQLEFTDNTKEIAGLHCLKTIASFPDNGIEAFDIWYTNELDIDNPNSNTPFMDIPGVMLEFNTLMGNANMHMMATKFEAQQIPQKEFLSPQDYRPVSKVEMESILNALMN